MKKVKVAIDNKKSQKLLKILSREPLHDKISVICINISMTLRKRRLLLALFSTLFVVFGIGALGYSQGYRLTFPPFELTKTGALYLESPQRSLLIYLNGKRYSDQAGLLKKGTLIDGLTPDTYALTIEKELFQSYQKELTIYPSKVTRSMNVLLVPQDIGSQVEKIYTLPKNYTLIDIQNPSRILQKNNTSKEWILSSSDPLSPQTNISSQIRSLTRKEFSSASFSPQQEPYLILKNKDTVSFLFSAQQRLTTHLQASSTPYLYTSFIGVENATSTDIYTYQSSEVTSLPFTDITSLFKKDNTFIVHHQDQLDLYIPSTETLSHIATTTYALLGPDQKKILIKEGEEYKLYFLEQDLEALDVKEHETLPLSLSENVKNVWWYDPYHLIVETDDSVSFIEISHHTPLVSYALIQDTLDEVFYNQQEKNLFYRKGSDIFLLDLTVITP